MTRLAAGLAGTALALSLVGAGAAQSAAAPWGEPSADIVQQRYTLCISRLGDAPRSADVIQGWITGCGAEARRR
jgi:hypothetical protein